jgi:hypothetical protein
MNKGSAEKVITAKGRRIGIALIVIGICLPLFLAPFISGYKDGAGVFNNLFGIKIVVAFLGKPVGIPYRIFLGMGVAFIFMGIWCLDMAKAGSKKDDDTGPPEQYDSPDPTEPK